MSEKLITAECEECESTFEVAFEEDYVSDETPSFCPFCGEPIDSLSEDEYIEDDELNDDDKWD